MIKRWFLILCTYVYIQGCGDPYSSTGGYCHDEGFLDMSSYLYIDNSGYYHMDFLEGHTQTFTTLKSETGLSTVQIYWQTDREYFVSNGVVGDWTDLVNRVSYTDDVGIGYTVLGVWEEFVGDTITVYCNYTNYNCNIKHYDSIRVIID